MNSQKYYRGTLFLDIGITPRYSVEVCERQQQDRAYKLYEQKRVQLEPGRNYHWLLCHTETQEDITYIEKGAAHRPLSTRPH